VRVDRARPRRYPWWQLILIGLVGLFEALFRPIARMWRSEDPLDTYGLAHLGSVAGDAMVAVALAGSVFFDIPVGEATSEVALYLVLTMAPLAIAGPFLVPLLDRAGPRRAISFGAALGRAVVCLYAAPRFGTLLLFPSALVLLVLAKVHGITRNGLAVAYAGPNEGLVRANARLGRIGVGGAILGAAPALALLKMGGASAVLYGASAAYAVAAMLNPASLNQVVHMALAAYVATGFGVAAVHAFFLLRDRGSRFHRRAFAIALVVGAVTIPLEVVSGDFLAKMVARNQPAKFAAMEGHYRTAAGAALVIGGLPDDAARETRWAIRVPGLLSFLAHGDFGATVTGLADIPRDEWPPTAIVHLAFDLMVALGVALLALAAVVDSLSRAASYATDIAEIAINQAILMDEDRA